MQFEIQTNSVQENFPIAKKILANMGKINVICLNGNLGSGKTTFCKALAANLGVTEKEIKSPSFALIRKYQGTGRDIYHLDLYRLQNLDLELLAEIHELTTNPANLLLIEWAEKLGSQLPETRIEIFFQVLNATTRKLKITSHYVAKD